MFTEFVNQLDAAGREAFHRTVIMAMDTPEAAAMRRAYYQTVLRRMGENVTIGVNVRIVNPQWIELEDNTLVSDGCTLIARGEPGIILRERARLKNEVYLDTETAHGYIDIGERVYIGTRCCLHGHKGLEIGADSLLAQGILITPASHTFADPDRTIYSQPCDNRKIVIGKDCYLGMGVRVVCYAETIGDGAVVGAGAVVTRPVPAYGVAVGVPAKIVKMRK